MVKKFSKLLLVLGILSITIIFLSHSVYAGNRSGTVTAQFLKIPLSARAVSMGGAQVAVAEGVSAIGFNPAGMMTVHNIAIGGTYTHWFADIKHSYFGAVKNIRGIGAVGASIVILSTDDMAVTTPARPEGTGEYFRASDYAFSLAYARQVSDQFMVGINFKIIQSYLYNTVIGASSFAFDIGTLYDIPILRSRLGVSLTNIGKDLQYLNEPYSLPTSLRFGILLDMIKEEDHKLRSTFQISRNNDAEEQYNFGGEYVFNNLIALRGGWKFAYDVENFTAGFGINLSSIGFNGKLDYGYNNFMYLSGTHSITLDFNF